jgi:demethylmenaquinone methyltransferase/2-methoxy-6-polyprenyl-1,4-benzoquinol methylase
MLEARGSRKSLVRAYNFFSFLYGNTAARLERQAVTVGLKRAQVQPGERILEVGVGTAAAFTRLQQRLRAGGELVGLDLSPGMLRATRRDLPDARLIQADARALPFVSDHFDLLWASYVLEIIPGAELTPLLEEFRRVLRPGGRLLVVSFSKEGEELIWWERLYRLTPTFLVPWLFGGCRPVQAESFVHAAGFVDVKREFIAEGMQSEIITARK